MGSGYSDLIKLRRFCEYFKQGYVSIHDRHKGLEAELEQELTAAEANAMEVNSLAAVHNGFRRG